jgi:hypothetical protein
MCVCHISRHPRVFWISSDFSGQSSLVNVGQLGLGSGSG